MARHVGVQADVVLEKEEGVLHLDPQATGACVTLAGLELKRPQNPPPQ